MSELIKPEQLQNNADEEMSLEELIAKIKIVIAYYKSKWLQLFVAGLIGGLLGLGYYFIQSPKYEAVCTFILDEKTSSGAGGLASLASNFGVDMGSVLGGGGVCLLMIIY
jgi:uncharacterized protein involved in exopolysaccharide biosynthesis